jgi:hypothetical protein
MEVSAIIEQIKYNCNISDARFWGHYSICGLLMRLRQLYFHEKGLSPWAFAPKEAILQWIAEREALWERLEQEDYRDVKIDNHSYDPFDAQGINRALTQHGFIYSAGYGMFQKPIFFLGALKKTTQIKQYDVYYVDDELCRDLSTSMAMLQDKAIFLRLQRLKYVLWEKFCELGSAKVAPHVAQAFLQYGIQKDDNVQSDGFRENMDSLCNEVSLILSLHELGEALENERSDGWLEMLGNVADRRAEVYLRGVKDMLADSSDQGVIQFIVAQKNKALLSFYSIFLEHLGKSLFPELALALKRLDDPDGWSMVEKARLAVYSRLDSVRNQILTTWRQTQDIQMVENFVNQWASEPCSRT